MSKTLGGFKKVFAVAVSAATLVGSACMFTACSNSFPEIRMTLSFNGETYTLNYKLYRDYYTQTVDHYMALIDEDYFDNTVIHDYQSDRMIGGGYTYMVDGQVDTENADTIDDLTALDYDGLTLAEDGAIKVIETTVWKNDIATNRLHGETTSNGHSIEDGSGLTNSYGSLGTYTYVTKDLTPGDTYNVTYKNTDSDARGSSPYYKNSVTSLFYVYTSSSSTTDSNYCVFGTLADDESKTALDDLLAAIDAYLEDSELESDDFTEEDTLDIADEFVDGGTYEVTYNVPVKPIVIKEVRVTKY